jgi:hypothetical protein
MASYVAAEVELAQQHIGRAELAITAPEEHERYHDQECAASGRGNPEVRTLGEKPRAVRERCRGSAFPNTSWDLDHEGFLPRSTGPGRAAAERP